MADITTTLVDNYTFLQTIFRDIPEDEEIAVCAFTEPPEDRTGWPVYAPYDNVVNRFINPAGKPYDANTFYCIASVAAADRLTRGGDAVKALYVVPLDDIGTKVKIEAVPLPPSYIIETSRGNFQYGYLLTEPCRDLPTARAVMKLVSKDHGDPSAPIAGKLIRLPQGRNNKRRYPEPWLVRCTLWEPDRRYSIDDLLEAFGVPRSAVQEEAERLTRSKAAKGVARDDDVWNWLLAEGHVVSDVNSEGFATIICPWHGNHTEDAANTASYSPLGCGGPQYGGARQFSCFHGHCADKDLEAFTRWYFRDRYVMAKSGHVYDLIDQSEMTFQNFMLVTKPFWRWGGVKGTVKVFYAMEWLMDTDRVTVVGKGFHPARPRIYNSNGDRLVNTWRPFNHPKVKDFDKALPIIAQLKYLFGEDLDTLLGFVGWTVWHPEDRIQYALLHISPQHGTGRGWLKALLVRLLVHDGYVRSTTLADFMGSDFNDWLWQSLLVCFDEVRERGVRFKVQDRLREVITEPRMAVNIKHGFKGTVDVFPNIMMFSNHLAPLDVPPEDRRIWPVVCPLPPLPEEQYEKLYELINDPEAIAQFYWFLKHHLDTKGFKPFARAPRNKWSAVVFGTDVDPLQTELAALVELLRTEGVRAMYRSHFFDVCRAQGFELPLTNDGRDWFRVNTMLSEIGVVRGARLRSPTGQTYALILDRDPSHLVQFPATTAKECARVLADPQFTVKRFK